MAPHKSNLHFTWAAWAPPWCQPPWILMLTGGLAMILGWAKAPQAFGYAYLVAFMFFLSLGLGALFLVMLHHLFDAAWSVPLRRFLEHQAFLLPLMAVLFLPIALLAPRIFPWAQAADQANHVLQAKRAYLNLAFFYGRAAIYFAIWSWLAYQLRYWSLRQDTNGDSACTYRLRRYAAGGLFLYAFTLSFAAIDWMKSLQYQWFSTVYGVIYFAGSVWSTLALTYLIALILQRRGPLREILQRRQFHDLGVMLFAFTVFYAYVNFSQYFLIWNAHLPEETFWYVQRERGTWWDVGLLIVFGHFFVPFLLLLRMDAKLYRPLMAPLCAWALLMHYLDLTYNILPVERPSGFQMGWMDVACLLFMGGLWYAVFARLYRHHAPYPLRDPRIQEARDQSILSGHPQAAAIPGTHT